MAPRTDREIIEKYFDFLSDQATCRLCSHILKSNRNFNLKTHLIKVHKLNESEFQITDKNINESFSKVLQKASRKRTVKIEINKKQLIRSYISLVTEDGVSFDFLDSENFKNIIDPVCRGLSEKYGEKICLNSNYCKQILQLVSANIRKDIKSELRLCLVSVKIDSAIQLSRKVFRISAQFIKNNEIQCRLLRIVELKDAGKDLTRNLATEVLNTLNKFELNLKQIVSITFDNSANLIKTAIYEDGQAEQDFDDGNETYLRNIQEFEDACQIHLDGIQICQCAAHMAQLCVLDVTKDSESKQFLLCCRNLIKFIKQPSNDYQEIFNQKGLTVPSLDCPSKWGSSYKMISSLKNAKDIFTKIMPVKNKSIDENFELSDSFWNFIEAYSVVFEPLYLTIIKFQEEQLHYGNFYAEWLKCKLCTEKILENGKSSSIEKIAKILLHSMEKRTKLLLNNENLISCLYLDPRFNHTLTPTQKLEAIIYLKNLYDRLKNVAEMHNKETEAQTSPATNSKSAQLLQKVDDDCLNEYLTEKLSPFSKRGVKEDVTKNSVQNKKIKIEYPSTSKSESNQFSEKADEYLNEYLTRSFVESAKENTDVYTKIENLKLPFLRVDANVLQFWRDKEDSDPELFALSNICFAVPSTQVSTDFSLSCLKIILANKGNQIGHETLENILLAKLNTSYLDKAIQDVSLYKSDD